MSSSSNDEEAKDVLRAEDLRCLFVGRLTARDAFSEKRHQSTVQREEVRSSIQARERHGYLPDSELFPAEGVSAANETSSSSSPPTLRGMRRAPNDFFML